MSATDQALVAAPREQGQAHSGEAPQRQGRTLRLGGSWITGVSSIAGPTEARGPLGQRFDATVDHLLGQKSWERAESQLLTRAVGLLCDRLHLRTVDFDLLLAGDLLNQTIAASFCARQLDIPFLGLYNACATFTEALGVAGVLCSGGFCRRVVVATSSHHDAAERQYRLPTEFGNQRPPSAQWTATGAAAVAVEAEAGDRPAARLVAFTPGRVLDYGVRDPFNMGAAMAPAAADTLATHVADLALHPGDFGVVYTGDLGRVGVPLCEEMLRARGLDLPLRDCGVELYDPAHQDVHAGGSGAGCSALVFAAAILPAIRRGDYRRACLCCTGALHSTTTYQQGESIPAVAHAVTLECPAGD